MGLTWWVCPSDIKTWIEFEEIIAYHEVICPGNKVRNEGY
jgi:hypothetical protein